MSQEDVGVIRKQRGRPHKYPATRATDVSVLDGEQQVLQDDDNGESNTPEQFSGMRGVPFSDVREVKKDIYQHVLELLATTADEETRRWQIIFNIFEYALVQMDAERHGIAITYATLMPEREDGIHSLYEVAMRGTEPWPFAIESQAYLGSTTLAGTAAMEQRMLVWDCLDETVRWQVEIDEFEKSACACPVTRAGRIAGVLIISSAQPGFFLREAACQAVLEYARLLALAFPDDAFQPYGRLHLMPMPPLKQQRDEIRETMVYRIMSLARTRGLARQEAATEVHRLLEQEFEERMQSQEG